MQVVEELPAALWCEAGGAAFREACGRGDDRVACDARGIVRQLAAAQGLVDRTRAVLAALFTAPTNPLLSAEASVGRRPAPAAPCSNGAGGHLVRK